MGLSETEFHNQLLNFFHAWRTLPELEKVEQNEAPNYEIDIAQLKIFFQQYKVAQKSIDDVKTLGMYTNVWQVSSLRQDEVRNTKVLKWLLDCKGDHGQKNKILLDFLKLLPEKFHKHKPRTYFTIDESCPLGEQSNRVDIEIDAPEFLLFVEVKINALEGKEQLKRYSEIAEAKAKGKDKLVVYLTRDGKLPSAYQDDEIFFPLAWNSISNLLNQYADNQSYENRAAWLIKQFSKHIKSF